MVPEALEKLRGWKKPRRVLVPSMGDLFHSSVPHAIILATMKSMMRAHQHTFLVLTKRPERMLRCCRGEDFRSWKAEEISPTWTGHPIPNVVLGCTVENQRRADERLSVLSEIASMGWRTWVSAEPLLERVDWIMHHGGRRPEFVAVGGETGPGARPCDAMWIRSVVGQCSEAGVRCHVKQLGKGGPKSIDEWPVDLRVREMVG